MILLVMLLLVMLQCEGLAHSLRLSSPKRHGNLAPKGRKLVMMDGNAINTVQIDSKSRPEDELPSIFPSGDALDFKILKLSAPAVLNLAILPLVGAVDTFWVGRMGEALCLAGQGAANQIFNSAFWIFSFLPSIVTPLVAKAAAAKDTEGVQKATSEAFFIATIMGLLGTFLLNRFPARALSLVLNQGSAAVDHATPYLAIRAITFLPALLSTVGFAAFRGTMDVVTPLKISALSNVINVVMDPVFIFKLGMGVPGAAAATCLAEATAFCLYVRALVKRKLINLRSLFKPPDAESLKPLLVGGLSVQMRAVALNIAFLAVTKTTQALDTTGTAAAAHAITVQLWQLGGIFLLVRDSHLSSLSLFQQSLFMSFFFFYFST
jgi:putative MATE family efflux protein